DLYRRRDGDVTIVDFKTNRLNGDLPDTVVDRSYGHQLTVYALAALRSGASSVTIVYAFLERPDEPVRRTFTAADTAQLEARLHAALEAIRAGEFQPTPDPLTCGECPLLDLACAGPALVGRIDEDPSRLRFEPEY
ncbi:MAG: PD-(D/E)XK nuclease family protein, partial [Gaiellales bacterium]